VRLRSAARIDSERRAEAGIPELVRFATKPQLAFGMIEAAVTAGLPCQWIADSAVDLI
jgi:SRSO17 transposase